MNAKSSINRVARRATLVLLLAGLAGPTATAGAASANLLTWGSFLEDSREPGHTPVPVAVPSGTRFVMVASGGAHAVALDSAGKVWSWGSNASGEIGRDPRAVASSATPLAVDGLPGDVVAVGAGWYTSYAVTSGGDVYAWGTDDNGELGVHPSTLHAGTKCSGHTGCSHVPVHVPLPPNIKAVGGKEDIDGGDKFAAVVATDTSTGAREVWAWGDNRNYELGSSASGTATGYPGAYAVPPTRMELPAGTTPVAVSANGDFLHDREFTLVLMRDGQVLEFGIDPTSSSYARPPTPAPRAVPLPRPAVAISTLESTGLALLDDGSVQAWGGGYDGERGDGTRTVVAPPAPVHLPPGVKVRAISAEGVSALALTTTGRVYGWGRNDFGQLGVPASFFELTPVAAGLPAGTVVTGVQAGEATLAFTSGSAVPPPVLGKRVTVERVSGVVLARRPGDRRFHRLKGGESIPVGSVVDARNGRVRLSSAANADGTQQQAALFYSGTFRVTQAKTAGGTTTLALQDRPSCGGRARAAKRRRVVKLWGDGKGNFVTRGRFASAAVRGTRWLTQETCAGTLIVVQRGVVAVRDLRRHKTVLVSAGHRYLARARGRVSGTARVFFFDNIGELIPASGPDYYAAIRPSTIFINPDGSWAVIRLHWTGWGSRVARGKGTSSASNGVPNLAEGKRIETPATITLSNRGRFRGHRVYRCFHLTVPPPATSFRRCLKKTGRSYVFE